MSVYSVDLEMSPPRFGGRVIKQMSAKAMCEGMSRTQVKIFLFYAKAAAFTNHKDMRLFKEQEAG